MIFAIESIVACLLFTLMVKIATTKKREAFVNDYPPVVADKLRKVGLIAEESPAKKTDIIRKLIAFIIFAVLFALPLRYINGIETFLEGMLTAYALWLVVDWYDFLVLDVLLAPFDKFYKVSGVSAFHKSAVWFHFKASLRGMVIGAVLSPIVGLLVMLF